MVGKYSEYLIVNPSIWYKLTKHVTHNVPYVCSDIVPV